MVTFLTSNLGFLSAPSALDALATFGAAAAAAAGASVISVSAMVCRSVYGKKADFCGDECVGAAWPLRCDLRKLKALAVRELLCSGTE